MIATLYQVKFSRPAETDLADIAADIAQRSGSEQVGVDFARRLGRLCDSLSRTPHRGTMRYEDLPSVRTFGYRGQATIAFTVDETRRTVFILAVTRGGRDVEALVERRLRR